MRIRVGKNGGPFNTRLNVLSTESNIPASILLVWDECGVEESSTYVSN